MTKYVQKINDIVEQLCKKESYETVYHRANHDVPMPSVEDLMEFVELCRGVIFPGYFGNSEVRPETIHFFIGTSVERIFKILAEQIKRGLCFDCGSREKVDEGKCMICEKQAKESTIQFIDRLPDIRRLLTTDVHAAFEGDPAAKSYGETIFCYPSIRAITNQRIAHALLELNVPLIPRIISEMAHSETGIDIHPGATIGEKFFIDHGTGVVIGETCVIGNNVRLYQGVTLGAKSFPMDENGNPIKGIPRHPIVQDDVVVYAGATVLGRVTIGKGASIGGNVWITYSVPPNAVITQTRAVQASYDGGSGI